MNKLYSSHFRQSIGYSSACNKYTGNSSFKSTIGKTHIVCSGKLIMHETRNGIIACCPWLQLLHGGLGKSTKFS